MTALQNRLESLGRHPLLKQGSLSLRIYNELRMRPEQRVKDVAHTLLEPTNSVRGSIQRMVGAGLLIPVKMQVGNRVVVGYTVNDETQTGYARDTVEVEVVVYVNDCGEYSARCAVVNQLPTASDDNPTPIKSHVVKVVVPKPREVRMRESFSESYTPGHARGQGPLLDLTPEKEDFE